MKQTIILTTLTCLFFLIGCDSTSPQADILTDAQNLAFSDEIDQDTLILRNDGDAPGDWRVIQHPSWLQTNKTNGTLEPGQTEAVTLTADLNQDVGMYDDLMLLEIDGNEISIMASLVITRAIDIFPGLGAGGLEIGDSYSKVINSYGTSSSQLGLPIDGGFLHLVRYDDQGIDFFALSGNGILISSSPIVGMNIYDPYNGVTIERIGVESSLDELTMAYGQPDEIDRDFRSYSYRTLGISPRYDIGEQYIEEILIFPPASSGKAQDKFPDLLDLPIYNEQIWKGY